MAQRGEERGVQLRVLLLLLWKGEPSHPTVPRRDTVDIGDAKPHHPRVSSSQLSQIVSQPAFVLPVIVEYSRVSCVLEALIYSRVAGNFIDQETVHQFNIPVRLLQQPQKIQAIDGVPIGKGYISHCTEPLILQASALHRETIVFCVTVSARHPIIQGLPWL